MRTLHVLLALAVAGSGSAARAQAPLQAPSGALQGGVAQPTVVPPPVQRSFSAPVGLWFHTVRPDRTADFERVVGHLRAALAASRDPVIRQQAEGWQMYRAAEPGPNGTVMYVFLMNPTVSGADYGLGRILADAYADTAELQEIWKLYTGSITGGGSLLNLTPVDSAAAPRPAGRAPAGGQR